MRISMEQDAAGLVADLRACVDKMKRAHRGAEPIVSKLLDTEFHQTLFRYSPNRYLNQSYATIGHTVEALRYRLMDTAAYSNQAFEEHGRMVDLLATGSVSRAVDLLFDHIARTKRFTAAVPWTHGRLRRKDYRFRDYAEIFANGGSHTSSESPVETPAAAPGSAAV